MTRPSPLADVAERERTQEAPERRWGVAVGEGFAHGAVALSPREQDRHVPDRVRARAHAGGQAHRLQVGVLALVRRDRDMRGDQCRKAGGLVSAMSGTSHADAIRFGSSNAAPIAAGA